LIEKINFNGNIVPANQPVFQANNRAFKYGDGLFETIRVFKGLIPFLDCHFNRLKTGLQQLKYEIPDYFSISFFEKEIQKLINQKGNHRVRLTVFRSVGGFYTPENNHPQFLIESHFLKDSTFHLNSKGLQVALFDEIKLPMNSLSNLKTCNSLPYILAGIFKKENGFDDCFLLNSHERIAECSSSNVFVLLKKTILTPSLSEACVAGTMRKIVLDIAHSNNFTIEETSIKAIDLKNANEIWLTNAIQGIRWVENYKGLHFENKVATEFVHLLNEKIKQNNS
jgi:branched-chain amino acid aminotransferase